MQTPSLGLKRSSLSVRLRDSLVGQPAGPVQHQHLVEIRHHHFIVQPQDPIVSPADFGFGLARLLRCNPPAPTPRYKRQPPVRKSANPDFCVVLSYFLQSSRFSSFPFFAISMIAAQFRNNPGMAQPSDSFFGVAQSPPQHGLNYSRARSGMSSPTRILTPKMHKFDENCISPPPAGRYNPPARRPTRPGRTSRSRTTTRFR